jgi:transcriptional regulator with PAS, ATPase and Fis domain
VLITGESGTGKELFAQAIHRASPRRAYPFVRVNCAALPRELLEAELFGYEKGSFTGADPRGKPGKFELAHLGTIFLDEIGDLPLDMQPKLLRVLELKEFERVGGTSVIASDFKLIAATNQNLDRMIKSGSFRRDLYYRLNVISVAIPPLRERRDDILPLAYHFIEKTVKGPEGKGIRIQKAAEQALKGYNWPGNGRELLHTIERILHISGTGAIRREDLPDYIRLSAPFPDTRHETNLKTYLQSAEKHLIEEMLRKANGNKSLAADLLGIHRTLLYRKMKLLGMRD